MKGIVQHIERYNQLNDKSVTKALLQSFLRDVQMQNKKTPHPSLDEIEARLTKAIKKVKGTVVAKIDKPIDYNFFTTTTTDMLNGLEEIENDKEVREAGLNGINDTAYQVITDRILELMKDNGLVWRKPWNDNTTEYETNLAHNYVTRHVYSAGNMYLNWLRFGLSVKQKDGSKKIVKYDSPYFFSFKQVSDLGGKVKKDEKGWPVIYFKWLYKNLKTNKLVDKAQALASNGALKPGYEKIPGIFYYTVFNYEQCENLNIKQRKVKPRTPAERIESAEQIIKNMPNAPKIEYTGKDAWYRRDQDLVRVPPIEFFKKEQHFYGVQFHELIHSTGHPKRLNREREVGRTFGDKKYAFEELIAELGSSFLCGHSGIFYYTVNNSAAYIKNWSTVLREEMEADPKFFLRAATKAQQAADYMLNLDEKEPEPKPKKEKKVKTKTRAAMKRPSKKKQEEPKQSMRSRPLGAVGADKLAQVDYSVIPLNPKYKEMFERLHSDNNLMISGEPGHGKTVLLLQFAQYLAEIGLNVLYISEEEYGKSTLSDKIREFNIGHPNLDFAGDLDESIIQYYNAIFYDSISSMNLSAADIKRLDKKFPNRIFVLIVQTTKDGDFKGGREWEHLVDIYGDVRHRKLILNKNRMDPENSQKMEKLRTSNAITEAKKKMQLRNAVKQQLNEQTNANNTPQS